METAQQPAENPERGRFPVFDDRGRRNAVGFLAGFKCFVGVPFLVLDGFSLCRDQFWDAIRLSAIRFTEKCSSDMSGAICGWVKSAVMNRWNTSPACNGSRFKVFVVGTQTASSGARPVPDPGSRPIRANISLAYWAKAGMTSI